MKHAIGDALLLRGSANFVDFESFQRFIDEVLSRKNAWNERRITAERAQLQPLPTHRTCDYEDTSAVVMSSVARSGSGSHKAPGVILEV